MSIDVATSKTLCDCGSGLLFSECHMLSFLPKEYLLVDVTGTSKSVKHVAYDKDDKEHELDAIIEMDLTLSDPNPWDNELSKIIKPNQNIPNKQILFEKRSGKLRHKLNGLKFHSNIFKKEEDRLSNEYRTSYIADNFNYALENPVLIFNTESFLFQTKSCLDVLSQIIGLAFRISVRTFKNNGDDLIEKIRKNPLKNRPHECHSMIKLLAINKKWITNAVDMRDEVTHYSNLEGLSCYMHRAWKGGNKAKIYYPSLPNRERVSTFMDETWADLTTLIRESYDIINSIYSSSKT